MKRLILGLIRGYKRISFFQSIIFTGCRFYPTCSDYTYQAIEKYGILKGGFMGMHRILRCNPWNKGGIDKLK